jgi:GDP/UDP-N,N'-diacetylbacillosamine 2-epimerase (hydrolysing)
LRKVISITGTRSDYGLMSPIYDAISKNNDLELQLIITGMHLLPEFHSSLEKIHLDNFGKFYNVSMILGEDSGKAMSQSLGLGIFGISAVFAEAKPDIVLLQGDRGEMLAGAIAAAHMNIPIIHMSGGDYTGSIDDSIRNAISKFSHIHLTTCALSSERLLAMGETQNRIFEVGEPGIDVIMNMKYIEAEKLAEELYLDLSKPIILATQHSVTTEADRATWQITQTLEALSELGIQTIFTYPNTDAGGREMVRVLETYRSRKNLGIIENLGSEKYLSLMKICSVMVGNSSSGILESPSFKIPVVNIGTRQHRRLRANNVIDVGYDKKEIVKAILFALNNKDFQNSLKNCKNPYGDGTTSAKTIQILIELRLIPQLLTKWINYDEKFC